MRLIRLVMSPVAQDILVVLGPRVPTQIARMVVRWIAVVVACVHIFRARPGECLQHQYVHTL